MKEKSVLRRRFVRRTGCDQRHGNRQGLLFRFRRGDQRHAQGAEVRDRTGSGEAVGGESDSLPQPTTRSRTKARPSKLSELAVGIGPFVVGPAVERKIGTAAFGRCRSTRPNGNRPNGLLIAGCMPEVHTSIEGVNEAVTKPRQQTGRIRTRKPCSNWKAGTLARHRSLGPIVPRPRHDQRAVGAFGFYQGGDCEV